MIYILFPLLFDLNVTDETESIKGERHESTIFPLLNLSDGERC
jgi:hypothetical protein